MRAHLESVQVQRAAVALLASPQLFGLDSVMRALVESDVVEQAVAAMRRFPDAFPKEGARLLLFTLMADEPAAWSIVRRLGGVLQATVCAAAARPAHSRGRDTFSDVIGLVGNILAFLRGNLAGHLNETYIAHNADFDRKEAAALRAAEDLLGGERLLSSSSSSNSNRNSSSSSGAGIGRSAWGEMMAKGAPAGGLADPSPHAALVGKGEEAADGSSFTAPEALANLAHVAVRRWRSHKTRTVHACSCSYSW